jgi:probable rRNA maturation factor
MPDSPETSPALDALAARIDESLVLAVACEPPEALADKLFGLDDAALRHIVALTLARIGLTQPVEVSLLITGDEGLRTLNREYRGRDEPTDVLSFPAQDSPLVAAPPEELWQTDEPAEAQDGGDMSYAEEDAAEALAFPLPEEQALPLGDIAISRDAVARQAAQAGHAAGWELAYLLAHGVLHLAGYDDHTEAGYRAMVAHQEAVLAHAGIARG